jgi:hypothetical protein
MSGIAEWFKRFGASGDAAPRREADRARPEAVLTKHAGRLMRMKGVLSVGIGRTEDGKPAIVLGLDSDAPDVIDPLPSTLDGVPVIRDRFGHTSAL